MEWKKYKENTIVCSNYPVNSTPVQLEVTVHRHDVAIQCKYPSGETRLVAGGDIINIHYKYSEGMSPSEDTCLIDNFRTNFAEPKKISALFDACYDAESILTDPDVLNAVKDIHRELFDEE